jgi:hypothetical protein
VPNDRQNVPRPGQSPGSRQSLNRNDSPRQPIHLEAVRRLNHFLELFGEPKPERINFRSGTVLIREGQSLNQQPALLIIEGKLEERKSVYEPGHGQKEQVLFIASAGDIVNIQGSLPEVVGQPSYSTLVATEDGYGLVIRAENISNLDSLGVVLHSLLRKNNKQWESFLHPSNLHLDFATLLAKLQQTIPDLPGNPVEILTRFYKVTRERDEQRKRIAGQGAREDRLNEVNRDLNEKIAELEHELKATRTQLSNLPEVGGRVISQGDNQIIESLRTTLAERDARIAELEKNYTASMHQHRQSGDLGMRLTELENANAALRRDKLKLSNKEREEAAELKALKDKLTFEARARAALELRNQELMQQLADQSSAASQAKFPSASILLESSELNDLEMDARRFRNAATHFEGLATMMQRAMELLAEDNPGMLVSKDVMMLMTGEEPPPRPSVEKARAHRDSADFRTVHLGSDSPEVAAARAKAHQATAVIGSNDPIEHAPQRARRPNTQPSSTHDVERFPTMDETPEAKRGPDAQSSRQLSERRHPTDRQITAVESPIAIKENKDGHRSGEHHAPPPPGPLSGDDMDSILREFVVPENQPETPRVSAPPSSTGVSAPYPGGPEEYSWASEDTEEPSSSNTRPFLPDSAHPAPDVDVSLPPEPLTPRLSEPARMATPVDGARRAGMISHDGRISQRHMHPVSPNSHSYTAREADSDITPVVPEFPPDEPPSLRSREQNRTRGWEGDTVLARPGEMPIRDREATTRREGSSPRQAAVTFPDEGTDIRQIREDWQNSLRATMPSSDPEEFPIPPSADIPPPPPGLFGEIEPEPAPEDLMSNADCFDQDELEGPTGAGTTQAYSSPGQVICRPIPQKPDTGDIRSTRAYQFKAPGKPPKPKS